MKEKYARRLAEHKEKSASEMRYVVQLIKQECEDIYNEVIGLEGRDRSADSSLRGSSVISQSHSAHRRSQVTLTPEMLSPQETEDLVKSILGRAAAANMSISSSEGEGSSTSKVSKTEKHLLGLRKRRIEKSPGVVSSDSIPLQVNRGPPSDLKHEALLSPMSSLHLPITSPMSPKSRLTVSQELHETSEMLTWRALDGGTRIRRLIDKLDTIG